MSRSFTKKIKALLLFLPLVFVISFCQNANAEMISADNLYKMSLLTSLRTCFEHANSPVSILGLDSWEKFFDTSGNWGKTNSQEVWITTHVGNTLKSDNSDSRTRDSNLSCEQLFKGYDGGKQGQAKGLLDLFQLPAINSTNMGAWGYKLQQSTTPSPSDEPTTGGNDVKITITDIKSLDGNQNPITSEGDITCHGFPQGDEGKNYHYFTNCEGEIKTYYHPNKEKTQLLFVIKATVNAPGRKWLAAAFDYNVNTTSTEYSGFSAPDDDTCVENKLDGCELLKWEHGPSRPVDELIRGAQNIHANDWSKKSMLEILNGDAASPQTGYGSLTYRIYMMAKSVFVMKYSEPSFKVKVEAVTNEGGGESGGGSQLETTNYEVISDKQTAGDIFAYNVNFDESLPHIGTQIGGVKFKNYYFDHTAKYSLYYRYLLEIINLWPDEININTCSETKPENGYYFKNKIDQWCNINIPGSLTEDTMGTNILKYTFSTAEDTSFQLRKGTFEQVLDWFKNEESYKDIPEDAYARGQIGDDGDLDPLDPDPGDGGGSGSSDACYTNSGSLGWIVCPVMNWLHKTLISLYNEAVEPMLQVDGRLLSNSATEEAWKIFRDIANIMFVILFLVVIISQLTGVGIDNYGIKKILPKMIVAAVLINLSYVICQLAVDISNIAGAGINGLLTDQAGNIVTSQSFGHSGVTAHVSGSFNASVMFETLLEVFMGALAVGGALGVIMTVMGSGVLSGLILPLLMGLITAFVAVLFFFALLGMRQAGVVILVVVSPVAFACYMLPNTKKLFDKWLKIFEGLLIVYPICGLLVGGSTFTSAILVSGTDSFFMWFIGMLLMVVPFFFIPTLLKGSFAAMGGIGAKISGLGKRFGKGLSAKTDKAVRSSDTYRRLDNFAGRHSISRKRRAAAVSSTAEYKKEMGARKRLSDRGNMKTRIAAIEAAEDAKATDEATSQRLSLMMSSGEGGGITMADGSKATYTLDNAERRTRELETKSRTSALTSEEQLELSALARGMSSMKGGAGRLGRIIRDSQDASGTGANTNFMSAMGEIYARDSIVQSKMNEKDMGASVYTEHFMPGGDGLSNARTGAAPTFTQTHGTYSGTTDYRGAVSGRVKSYAAGLNQGGAAVGEYIESLTEQDCQAIMDDEKLLTSLDTDVRQQFLDYAAGRTSTTIKNGRPTYDYSSAHTGWSVTEPRAKNVQFRDGSKEMQALGNIENSSERVAVNTERTANGIDDVNSQLQRHTRASMDAAATTLDNETLMEIATNPQAKMDDPLREAAEREAKRRIQDGKMNP